ncbi:MAG TPA: alpha/beta fold hydrolase [Gammaproteobacteria bacterium]|jgi:homoserine O-acetyltransferase|nr:alpha/beta fold hydrolase [Gammaproteobacteria bacterium]
MKPASLSKKNLGLFALLWFSPVLGMAAASPTEGDYIVPEFHFQSGEVLQNLRLHYTTYGQPARDASGHVTNAVMILHGTGGSGQQFTQEKFAGVLFGPGQLLDASHYYIILPDGIGHGRSSKPSDGLRMRFPHYDYTDMVAAQRLLLTDGLKVDHLRLLMGMSMGCMQTWMWLEAYPGFVDAGMPLACLTVQIAGRNRMWRKMAMDDITTDPDWHGGEYTQQPHGLISALDLLVIMGSAPLEMQKDYPTRELADADIAAWFKERLPKYDANDLLYQLDSSRDYDPSARLGEIKTPVMYVNSADDMVNPPELGIAQQAIKQVKDGKFVLLPITDQTRGHGTHTLPAIWKDYLAELLTESGH